MIQLREISIRQGAFRLSNVNLEIPEGLYGVLMGKSGCGKTSLLEAIAGLRAVHSGRIFLGDRDVTPFSPGERGIGYVPQDAVLFRTMSIHGHLAFAMDLRRMPRIEIEHRVAELSRWLGIEHLLKRRPAGLSGGEAQRVAIGRALSFRPRYLLLDEPLSSLDETTRESLIDLLLAIRESRQATILHVTHNESEARRLADVRFRLTDGKLARED